MTDIDIARAARMKRISEIAGVLGIEERYIEPYGRYKAKLSLNYIDSLKEREDGRLILVTAMTPTPPGEGKTTTSIGLGDALNRIGKRTIICLREPSLGPCFGMKGGAAGGGRAQVVPMEDINLHFTGDFHAVAVAHNLLAALVDNHIHQGNECDLDDRRVTWRRVMDVNDRVLRKMVVGLGGLTNGHPREAGFDIVPASEVMAILCLAESLLDLKQRLASIMVGHGRHKQPVHARDLSAQGAMSVLLKDALKPNLVQTLENNPAFVHGGPFANIAHGCNSVIATKTALKLADYVVTEAGFGADLGAEKFIDIKCRKASLTPSMVVLVVTIRALKYQGGAALKTIHEENLPALAKGLPNLERHMNNIRSHYGLPCIIAINRFATDSAAEIQALEAALVHHGVHVIPADHWAQGGLGAEQLAQTVVEEVERIPSQVRFVYREDDPLWRKIEKVATKIYDATEVVADTRVRERIRDYQEGGYGYYPVCIAKTQYSFSSDPKLRGAPSGHVLPIRDVYLAAGAEFLVAICGDVMTMPGLPRTPAAHRIDLDDQNRVTGLF